MIEMLSFLMCISITSLNYEYSIDLRIVFKNGTHRFLRDDDNISLRFYFKDEIKYV